MERCRRSPRTRAVAAGFAASLLVAVSCGDGDSAAGGDEPVIDPGDGGDYAPSIDRADFVEGINHPFLPLRPGARWIYEGTEGGETERVEVVVTDERRDILGIPAVVVRDTVTVDGELVEDTFDWFAQDREGNVWYLGEDSTEYEDGQATSTEGSWEAGVDDAQPGIVMPAVPAVGDAYRQEYDPADAEDLAEVIGLDGTASVPFGDFDHLLVTREWTPLEPEIIEEKSYAAGVGLIFERKTSGGEGRVELVEYAPAS